MGTAAETILESVNYAKALELKLLHDKRGRYVVYLGELPLNIVSGGVASPDDTEPEYLLPTQHSSLYNHPTYRDAVRTYENLKMKYME